MQLNQIEDLWKLDKRTTEAGFFYDVNENSKLTENDCFDCFFLDQKSILSKSKSILSKSILSKGILLNLVYGFLKL